MNLFRNPEFRRNLRTQLRPGRVAATAAIAAALSLSYGYASYKSTEGAADPGSWGQALFDAALWLQVLVLTVGGGFACLVAISREKEHNTFDFQRVTRLTPLELTLGKLFGAPALSYFIVLCLLPAAAVGAIEARLDLGRVLAAYAVLLICAVAWHSMALLVSLLVERNSASAGGLLYLVMLGLFSIPSGGALGLGMMSPFFAISMLSPQGTAASAAQPVVSGARYWDSFFGLDMHHGAALALLSLVTLAWLLLALARNIKRDPAVYELFTPAQSLGLAAYINLVFIGFFQWRGFIGHDAHRLFTFINLGLFFGLGLTVMRNRDRLRRRLSELGERASGWLAAFWPATYVLGGFLAIGLALLAVIGRRFAGAEQWNLGVAMVTLTLASLWLARDVMFIQWMVLTRVRRPLVMSMIYLIVYYTCTAILLGAVGLMQTAGRLPFAAIFLPSLSLGLDAKGWEPHRAAWLLAVAAQVPVLCVLAMLKKQKLQELSARPPAAATAVPASAS